MEGRIQKLDHQKYLLEGRIKSLEKDIEKLDNIIEDIGA